MSEVEEKFKLTQSWIDRETPKSILVKIHRLRCGRWNKKEKEKERNKTRDRERRRRMSR